MNSHTVVKNTIVCAIALGLLLLATACGGGSSTPTLAVGAPNTSTSSPPQAANVNDVIKSTGVLITEDEIPTLPQWQQRLLSDPGWNQPYIPPLEPTAIEPPTDELLLAELQKEAEDGNPLVPRSQQQKGASWIDPNHEPPGEIEKGEYENLLPDGNPLYGCNYWPHNSAHGNALEDVIFAGNQTINQRISYVLDGWSLPNHFNETGGTRNSALSAVYQLFCTERMVDPFNPPFDVEIGELSYRADLAPGIPPNGDCTAATAYAVNNCYWRVFNEQHDIQPLMQPTALYNILIAPATELSTQATSSGQTVGRYQEFYFGTVGPCYGGAWMVGLESSTSDCEPFNTLVTENLENCFFFNPVYGLLLKRWQDAQITGMNWPWENELGWPVHGPIAYANGSPILSARGHYYAWGMWFERGFIWWIDYDQDTYPMTPDEAHMYRYTGSNVYCRDGFYEFIGPVIYYGGEGPLAATIVVDAMRAEATHPWEPVPLSEDRTYYEVPLMNEFGEGIDEMILSMHAHGYGGVPNDECLYKYFVWAFRDGTIQAAGAAYDPTQAYVNHAYGSLDRNEEAVYTVRVQVTDASLDLGLSAEEVVGYGDSLPIHLGHNQGSLGGLLIVRNDNHVYDENYDAIISDIQDIITNAAPSFTYTEMDYYDGIAPVASQYGVVLWYRGGPADEANALTANYTDAETRAIRDIMASGTPVAHFTQNMACFSSSISGVLQYWIITPPEFTLMYMPVIPTSGGWTEDNWPDTISGTHRYRYVGSSYSIGTPCSGINDYSYFGSWGAADLGERYSGPGSSGIPLSGFTITPHQTQYCIAYYSTSGQDTSDWRMGVYVGASRLGSWGNIGQTGPSYGRCNWTVGYPWANLEVTSPTGMERYHVLMNILASLRSDVFGITNDFVEYDDIVEIVCVTPGYWTRPGYTIANEVTNTWDGVGGTGFWYPDQTGTNVYRNTDPGGNYVITSTPNNDWINGNDVDFQFPWYAYIEDPDLSLIGGVDYGDPSWPTMELSLTGDESLYAISGLLVDDPGSDWIRVDPNQVAALPPQNWTTWNTHYIFPADPRWEPAGALGNRLPPLAGYYVSANTTGEAGVRATYGGDAPVLTWDSTYPLTVETIAHWPQGFDYNGSPAMVYWSMFPGHFMIVPGFPFEQIPFFRNWEYYRTIFDVDPSVFIDLNGDPFTEERSANIWNRPQFELTTVSYEGRVIEFGYSQIPGWNGDLNRSGAVTAADKFPIRCRLFTDLNDIWSWATTWPDHLYDAGVEPGNLGDADYVEGGCYVVDVGAPVPVLDIYDDATQPDPSRLQFAPQRPAFVINDDFTLTLYYGIANGDAPYAVELDAGFDPTVAPTGYGDWLEAFGQNDPAQVYTVATGVSAGLRNDTVTLTQPVRGYYSLALRVTDDDGNQDVIWYGDPALIDQDPVANLVTVPPHPTAPPYDEPPHTYDFDASSSADPDGTIVQYDWDWEGDGTFDLIDGGATPSHLYNTDGDYYPTVRAYDNFGMYDDASITLVLNLHPIADLSSTSSANLDPGDSLLLDGSASSDPSPGGSIVLYNFDFGEGAGWEGWQAGSSISNQYNTDGDYTIRLQVQDDDGDVSNIDTMVVVVNTHPVADLQNAAGTVGNPVTLDASLSTDPSPGGSIVLYEFDPGDGSGWQNNGTNNTMQWTYGSANVYTAQVRVTDDDGDIDTDTATITII